MIRALSRQEVKSGAFRKLLWLAVEVDDEFLDHIVRHDLATLTIIGIAEPTVLAFVAYKRANLSMVIEYIAVEEAHRGRRIGSQLIDAVRVSHPDLPIYAQTDDDAVNFYRGVGFRIAGRSPDPRWPSRRRYDCVLDVPPEATEPAAD